MVHLIRSSLLGGAGIFDLDSQIRNSLRSLAQSTDYSEEESSRFKAAQKWFGDVRDENGEEIDLPSGHSNYHPILPDSYGNSLAQAHNAAQIEIVRGKTLDSKNHKTLGSQRLTPHSYGFEGESWATSRLTLGVNPFIFTRDLSSWKPSDKCWRARKKRRGPSCLESVLAGSMNLNYQAELAADISYQFIESSARADSIESAARDFSFGDTGSDGFLSAFSSNFEDMNILASGEVSDALGSVANGVLLTVAKTLALPFSLFIALFSAVSATVKVMGNRAFRNRLRDYGDQVFNGKKYQLLAPDSGDFFSYARMKEDDTFLSGVGPSYRRRTDFQIALDFMDGEGYTSATSIRDLINTTLPLSSLLVSAGMLRLDHVLDDGNRQPSEDDYSLHTHPRSQDLSWDVAPIKIFGAFAKNDDNFDEHLKLELVSRSAEGLPSRQGNEDAPVNQYLHDVSVPLWRYPNWARIIVSKTLMTAVSVEDCPVMNLTHLYLDGSYKRNVQIVNRGRNRGGSTGWESFSHEMSYFVLGSIDSFVGITESGRFGSIQNSSSMGRPKKDGFPNLGLKPGSRFCNGIEIAGTAGKTSRGFYLDLAEFSNSDQFLTRKSLKGGKIA